MGLVIWAAGITASPLAAQLGRTDRGGRIAVGPDLAVPGHNRIYALGDAAAFMAEDGRPLPGLAQVAKQQGLHLGRGLAAPGPRRLAPMARPGAFPSPRQIMSTSCSTSKPLSSN